jgi:hypothetical protein
VKGQEGAMIFQTDLGETPFEWTLAKPEAAPDFYRQVARYIADLGEWPLITQEESWPTVRARRFPRYVPINLEQRLQRLEESVAMLSEALLTRPVVSSTQIVDLNSDEYSVRHPIPAVIAVRKGGVTATFPEVETQGEGSSTAEAISDLKQQIILRYQDLKARDPETLEGPPRGWWRVLQHYVAEGEIERLPAAYKVDWMVDNVPGEYLPAMTKDVLGHVIRSCRSPDVQGLAELLSDWEATVEELIADGEELDQVLLAMDEIRNGKGIPWDEAKKRLGL